MKEELRIVLVQENVQWEDKRANLDHLQNRLASLKEVDIVVLPEMFTTGFSMNTKELAEDMSGESVSWMKAQAKDLNAVIVGSLIIEDGGQCYNRLVWASPDGKVQHYNKRHLFSFAEEDDFYTAGTDRLIVEWEGWKICPLVCYDLRFPVWSRNQKLDGTSTNFEYDLMIYVANWPEARRRPWINLLEARAHENQAYVAGVNRIGTDGNGITYSGDSAVYSPKGNLLTDFEKDESGLRTATILKSELEAFRSKFGAWRDKDTFNLRQ